MRFHEGASLEYKQRSFLARSSPSNLKSVFPNAARPEKNRVAMETDQQSEVLGIADLKISTLWG